MRVDVNALLHEEYKRVLADTGQSVRDLIDLAVDMLSHKTTIWPQWRIEAYLNEKGRAA